MSDVISALDLKLNRITELKEQQNSNYKIYISADKGCGLIMVGIYRRCAVNSNPPKHASINLEKFRPH